MRLRFHNSNVHHISRQKTEYVEGYENRMSGTLIDGELLFSGINSHGDYAFMKGRAKQFGRIFIMWGKAYGYKEYPAGRTAFGIAWLGKKKIYLVAPNSFREILKVSVEYEVL